MRINAIYRKALRIVRTEGLLSLLLRAKRRMSSSCHNGVSAGIMSIGKINIVDFYDFVLAEEAGTLPATSTSIQANTINWLIPDFGIGSGGHLNIFRYIHMLEKEGYKNTICLVGNHRHASPESAQALIAKNFFLLQANVVFGVKNLPPAYFSFATAWTTAYALKEFGQTMHKLYFVQDFEPAFYAHGSEYDFAEETYKFGFTGVCAGDWLANLLKNNYDMPTYSLGFSFDKDLYNQTDRREPETRRVFCYCRPPTVRRGLETALLALNLVGQNLPNVEFVFAGWDMSEYHFPHKHLNAGLLSLDELPDLYSQCDVALVLSFTNLSLLPLEIMACGCVVVSNRGPNTEWLLNDRNSILTSSTPKEIANSIVNIIEDSDLRSKITSNAKSFSLSTSWEDECRRLIAILNEVSG